jgi:hypothetical protein
MHKHAMSHKTTAPMIAPPVQRRSLKYLFLINPETWYASITILKDSSFGEGTLAVEGLSGAQEFIDNYYFLVVVGSEVGLQAVSDLIMERVITPKIKAVCALEQMSRAPVSSNQGL